MCLSEPIAPIDLQTEIQINSALIYLSSWCTSPCTGETPSKHPDTSSSLDVQLHIPVESKKKKKVIQIIFYLHCFMKNYHLAQFIQLI
jgi:hypothetical protein